MIFPCFAKVKSIELFLLLEIFKEKQIEYVKGINEREKEDCQNVDFFDTDSRHAKTLTKTWLYTFCN